MTPSAHGPKVQNALGTEMRSSIKHYRGVYVYGSPRLDPLVVELEVQLG